MADIAAVLGLIHPSIEAFNSIFHFLKDKTHSSEEKDKKILELETLVLKMRTEFLTLHIEMDQLKIDYAEKSRLLNEQVDWKNKSALYALMETEGGAYVYKHTEIEDGIPYCPNCFEKDKGLYPLQLSKKSIAGTARCTNCKNLYSIRDSLDCSDLVIPMNSPFS